MEAYQGYFKEDGRFVPDNLIVKIPTNRRVIVNVLDEEITANKAVISDDKGSAEKRLEMLESITGIISPDIDVDTVIAERKAKRGLMNESIT